MYHTLRHYIVPYQTLLYCTVRNSCVLHHVRFFFAVGCIATPCDAQEHGAILSTTAISFLPFLLPSFLPFFLLFFLSFYLSFLICFLSPAPYSPLLPSPPLLISSLYFAVYSNCSSLLFSRTDCRSITRHATYRHPSSYLTLSHLLFLFLFRPTGAVCLEIFKLLQDKPLSAYSNTFTSLGVNLFTSMEPQPPNTTTTVVKGKEWKWTQVIYSWGYCYCQ